MDGVGALHLGDDIVHLVHARRRWTSSHGCTRSSTSPRFGCSANKVAATSTPTPTRAVTRGRPHAGPRVRGSTRSAELERRGEGFAFVPDPPPGSSRDGHQGHGVLPDQQRRGRGGVAHGSGRARARHRLGRAPRQRHAGHLLGRRRGALCLHPPAPALPGHRKSRRGRRCGCARTHGEPAAATGSDGRRCACRLGRGGARRNRGLRPRLGAGVLRVRRPPR